MYCPNCGHPGEVGKFCTNCGKPLPGNGSPVSNNSGAPEPKQNTSTPGRLIKKKLCDGLFEKGEMNAIGKRLPGAAVAAEIVKKISGGIWVAGSVMLYTDALEFKPNVTNTWLISGDLTWRIPLEEVQDVTSSWGFGARIITITTATGNFKIRCLGAENLVGQINQQRKFPG